MAQQNRKGLVFVSYAHADRARVEPLVNVLKAHFNVWWDPDIEIGQIWRNTLMEQLDAARCVVVVWTRRSVTRDFIWSELDRVKHRGVLVPVKLDRAAKIPLGFDQFQHLDLTRWKGSSTKAIAKLLDRVGSLMARSSRARADRGTLGRDDWGAKESLRASRELRKLTGTVRTIGAILIPGTAPSKDLLGSLKEVHRTYESVGKAISRFLTPATQLREIDINAYLEIERGTLVTGIRNHRGHCTRIVEYYIKAGGLREWLARDPKNAKLLRDADAAFSQLGTADNDLFDSLAGIGDVLTDEARAIAGFLLAGQQRAARNRIIGGRKKLLPLERSLATAMSQLQDAENSLGFVASPVARN